MGRRLWIQLCNQDWFSVGFSEMYSIQKLHYTTRKPLNINDQTSELLPDEIPVGIKFTSCLNDLAATLAQMYDAVTAASTPYTKYEQVLAYDTKIRAVCNDNIPKWLDSREPFEPHWPKW
ncbi:MAG: hypothetical protein M1823_007718, partial [Watsoniomyces obsoletus]